MNCMNLKGENIENKSNEKKYILCDKCLPWHRMLPAYKIIRQKNTA